MKKENIKIIRNVLIAIAIIYFGYVLIIGEVRQKKETTRFCKEQCNYNSDTKNWELNLKWIFDENQVESRIDTKKSFPEKEFNECINYCGKDLQNELKYLTSDPPDSRPY